MLFNKNSIALSIAASFALSLSIPALADNNKTQGHNNGQPFQQIRSIIDENRILIDDNQTDINQLKSTINQLTTSVVNINERMAELRQQITHNGQNIDAALVKVNANADELIVLRTELINTSQQLNTAINSIRNQITAVESDVDTTVTELKSANNGLMAKMAELEQAIASNALATDGIQIQVIALLAQVSTLSADATHLNWSYQDLQTRLNTIELGHSEIEQQIFQLTNDIEALKDSVSNNAPKVNACFSVNNTGDTNIKVSTWFDRCIDAQGAKVKVVLRDQQGTTIYEAQGEKVGDWSYNYITSSRGNYQENPYYHDRKITLDNGDILVITGRNGSGYACGTESGNGYVIRVLKANTSHTKMIVTSYQRLGGGWGGKRYFSGWTPNHEISYNNGERMYGCTSNESNQFKAFYGSFDFYVLSE